MTEQLMTEQLMTEQPMTGQSTAAQDLTELASALGELLGDQCTPERLAATEGRTDLALWDLLDRAGLTRVGLPENGGGSGGGLAEAFTVLRVAGEHGAAVPLAETSVLAGWLLAEAGLDQPVGIATTGAADVRAERRDGGWWLSGEVSRVPSGRDAELLVFLVDGRVASVPVAGTVVVHGANLAGEPRDRVTVDGFTDRLYDVPAGTAAQLRLRAGLSRTALAAGALARARALTVRYAQERRQFGRPLSAFQAVQHQIAALASEEMATRSALDGAVRACGQRGFDDPSAAFAVAAARVQAAQASQTGAAIAHQVHGALGMTHEHALRFTTSRLWAWRSECGNEATWSEQLADAAAATTAGDRWPLLVGGS